MGKKPSRREVVRNEFADVDLGDKRRERRSVFVADRLAALPEASLPDAMRGEANLEALYRHLGNEDVTMEGLLAPHRARTAKRARALRVVFAPTDTTSYKFSGEAERDGLGPVNAKDQGFLAHVTLLVAADGTRTPLGVIEAETWVRQEVKKSEKESARWGRSMLRAAQTAEGVSLIHVADRESDIYDLLVELTAKKQRFILRAAQDRSLVPLKPEDETRLFEAARTSPPAFAIDVPISARKSKGNANQDKTFPVRRSRTAHLSFASLTVQLKRPRHASRTKVQEALKVNVVHVFELGPPPGEPPVEWLLLTSEPVGTQDEIAFVVDGYRTRWVIEEYFKATKTGCAFETKQLESFGTLSNLLAYVLVIAYALILMRALSRTGRDEPASAVLAPTQIKILRALNKKLPPKLTVRTALLAIASLGGHLKNNGDPGWRTLSKGWRKLIDYEAGYELAVALGALK